MSTLLRALAAALFALPLAAFAVGGMEQASQDGDWDRALAAVAAKDWNVAIGLLKGVASRDGTNAEVHNQLGFAYRQHNDLEKAFAHYREALRLAPNHLGAHEYVGEAYLKSGDVASARKHLAILEKLCGRDCEEYRDLAKAIARAR